MNFALWKCHKAISSYNFTLFVCVYIEVVKLMQGFILIWKWKQPIHPVGSQSQMSVTAIEYVM